MNIEYIAHSAFYVESGAAKFLIDPFISGNPLANFDWQSKDITDIFVTHAHSDHLGDSIEIAKVKNARITAVFELANYCNQQGAQRVNGVNLGGAVDCGWGKAYFTRADHSSTLPNDQYGGVASGVVISVEGKTLYHAGDTAVFSDMSLIGELYKPDVAMLPIGAHFTMGVEEALVAAKLLGVKRIIPMHYNTFAVINADVQQFKQRLELIGIECVLLKPGEKFSVV